MKIDPKGRLWFYSHYPRLWTN